jgi:hypothetical protein
MIGQRFAQSRRAVHLTSSTHATTRKVLHDDATLASVLSLTLRYRLLFTRLVLDAILCRDEQKLTNVTPEP